GFKVPLPHVSRAQRSPGTGHSQPSSIMLQSALQPSSGLVLPSSQASPTSGSYRPLPHTSSSMQAAPTSRQEKPSSTMAQSAEQPSPPTSLPSSQSSPSSSMRLPHVGAITSASAVSVASASAVSVTSVLSGDLSGRVSVTSPPMSVTSRASSPLFVVSSPHALISARHSPTQIPMVPCRISPPPLRNGRYKLPQVYHESVPGSRSWIRWPQKKCRSAEDAVVDAVFVELVVGRGGRDP